MAAAVDKENVVPDHALGNATPQQPRSSLAAAKSVALATALTPQSRLKPRATPGAAVSAAATARATFATPLGVPRNGARTLFRTPSSKSGAGVVPAWKSAAGQHGAGPSNASATTPRVFAVGRTALRRAPTRVTGAQVVVDSSDEEDDEAEEEEEIEDEESPAQQKQQRGSAISSTVVGRESRSPPTNHRGQGVVGAAPPVSAATPASSTVAAPGAGRRTSASSHAAASRSDPTAADADAMRVVEAPRRSPVPPAISTSILASPPAGALSNIGSSDAAHPAAVISVVPRTTASPPAGALSNTGSGDAAHPAAIISVVPRTTESPPAGALSNTGSGDAAHPAAAHAHAAPSAQANGSKTPAAGGKAVRVGEHVVTLQKAIGRGGSSEVFQVCDQNGDAMALKVVRIRPDNQQNPMQDSKVQEYLGEIQLLERLRGTPEIVHLHASEVQQKVNKAGTTIVRILILLELADCSLSDLLRLPRDQPCAPNQTIRRLSPIEYRHWFAQMLQALRASHAKHIAHLDIKPANFILKHGRVKLIDFGIARRTEHDETVNLKRLDAQGTLNYMSPEALDEEQRVGFGADIWAMGVILYEMASGRKPFKPTASTGTLVVMRNIAQAKYDITACGDDRLLQQVLQICLDPDRTRRDKVTVDALLRHPFLHPELA